MKMLSICIPCFNESQNIEIAYQRITEVMQGVLEVDYEIVFADNNSTDGSQDVLRALTKRDERVKAILNQSNYGPLRSGMNCLLRARGDAVISFPCDLQEPPEAIPHFVRKWLEGNKVVWGRKTSSGENGVMYRIRALYYKILNHFSETPFYEQVDGFGILDREVVDQLRKLYAPYRGVKTIVSSLGYDVAIIPYVQNARLRGESTYSIGSYFRLALDTLVEISSRPVFIIASTGGLMSLLACMLLIGAIVWVCVTGLTETSPLLLMMALLILLLSLLLLALGVIGTYVVHMFQRCTPQPMVIEKESLNFPNEKEEK